jgi:hypothetical protein
MGRRERRELASRITVLLAHLLEWSAQPAERSSSWEPTIATQRTEIADLLNDNPSLRSEVPSQTRRRWPVAVKQAVAETNLAASVFPPNCPWSVEQILDEGFHPE